VPAREYHATLDHQPRWFREVLRAPFALWLTLRSFPFDNCDATLTILRDSPQASEM
jgi:hypothetical protein